MAKAKKTTAAKSKNPLAKGGKQKAGKEKNPAVLQGVENEDAATPEPGADPFGAGAEDDGDDNGASPAAAPAQDSAADPFGGGKGKSKSSKKVQDAVSAPLTGASVGSTDLKNLKTFTVEGEYITVDGKNTNIKRFKEQFVLSADLVESQARSLIKKLLIAGRLKDTKENFRRVRTHQITNVTQTTAEELKTFGLKHAVVDKMGMGELALFVAHNGLDVIPHKFGSIQEARWRVADAYKSPKRVHHVPKDAYPKKYFPGQVSKENKPLDNGLIG